MEAFEHFGFNENNKAKQWNFKVEKILTLNVD